MAFLQFWLSCLWDGFKFSFETFGYIDAICVVITAALYWQKKHYQKFWEEKGEPFIKKWALFVASVQVIGSMLYVAYIQYDDARIARQTAENELNDKSPKLNGHVDQLMIWNEPNTTNAMVVLQAAINNAGGSPSLAESYRLTVTLATNNATIKGELIDIPDRYSWDVLNGEKVTVYGLNRSELISEKTRAAIQSGGQERGWLAFRFSNILLKDMPRTNYALVLSFSDVAGKEIFVTNGFRNGKAETNSLSIEIPKTLPGSLNLVETNFQLPNAMAGGWMPPELPPGCSNVTIFFGGRGLIYTRFMAEISPESGKQFTIKDVPDYFLTDLEKMEGYSPRQRDIWLKYSPQVTIGDKTFSYPIQPIIVSNRLYVQVELPFSNEKHKIVMSDAFDSELPIPPRWDRNYSTNYSPFVGLFAYEVVNELTNPVLQVVYTAPNEILINGIFQVDSNSIFAAFYREPRLFTLVTKPDDTTQGMTTASLKIDNFHETLLIHSNETIASYGQRLTNEFFKPIFEYQRAIFEYPSNRKLGVLAKWSEEIITGHTNITNAP